MNQKLIHFQNSLPSFLYLNGQNNCRGEKEKISVNENSRCEDENDQTMKIFSIYSKKLDCFITLRRCGHKTKATYIFSPAVVAFSPLVIRLLTWFTDARTQTSQKRVRMMSQYEPKTVSKTHKNGFLRSLNWKKTLLKLARSSLLALLYNLVATDSYRHLLRNGFLLIIKLYSSQIFTNVVTESLCHHHCNKCSKREIMVGQTLFFLIIT